MTVAETWPQYFERVRLAAIEGLCPEHGTALEPAPYHPRSAEYRAFGWCGGCRLYYRSGEPGTGIESGYGLEDQRHSYQEAAGLPIS
jgi:hypothetical protein